MHLKLCIQSLPHYLSAFEMGTTFVSGKNLVSIVQLAMYLHLASKFRKLLFESYWEVAERASQTSIRLSDSLWARGVW